jgi:sugar O-acyltransferase (sialic acid O-acetyltransferase NeuD family)
MNLPSSLGSNMEEIIIFGLGDIAQIANYYFKTDSNYKVVAFTVDRDYVTTNEFEGLPVLPFDEVVSKYPPQQYKMFIALSYAKLNKLREQKYNEAKKLDYQLVSYVSSKCSWLTPYEHGDNCFIFEDNTIQPFVRIGNNVTLWSGNHIGHHSTIHDHNFISSHVVVSGHCVINSNSFLGVNSTIGHQVEIGRENIIGAGSIITKNTGDFEVYVPAKSVKLDKSSSEIKL